MNLKKQQKNENFSSEKTEILTFFQLICFLMNSFQERISIEKEYIKQLKKLGKDLEKEKKELGYFKDAGLLIDSTFETASAHEMFVKKVNHIIDMFLEKQNDIILYFDSKNKTKTYSFERKRINQVSGKITKRGKNYRNVWRKLRDRNRRQFSGLKTRIKNNDTLVFEKLQFLEKSLLRKLVIGLETPNLECARRIVKNAEKNLESLQTPLKKINTYDTFDNKSKKDLENETESSESRNNTIKALCSKLKFKTISVFRKRGLSQVDIFSKKYSSEKVSRIHGNCLNNNGSNIKNVFEILKKKDMNYNKKNPFMMKNNITERGMLKTIKINNILCFNKDKFDNIGFKKYNYQIPTKENLVIEVLEKASEIDDTEKTHVINFIPQKKNNTEIQNENTLEVCDTYISESNTVTQVYEKPIILGKNFKYEETHTIYNVSNNSLQQKGSSVSPNMRQTLSEVFNSNVYQSNLFDSFMENKFRHIILPQSNMLLLNYKHTELTKQGLNCSIIEVVNACIKNKEHSELMIQGEVAFSYMQEMALDNFLSKLVVQINSFGNFLKIMFNKNILENISNNPPQYFLDLRYISKMIPVLRYQVIINANKDKFQPILVTSRWKHMHEESTIIITYRKNPSFLHLESTLTLQDLSFIVGPENVLIKACQSKPKGKFYKKQNKLIFSLGSKVLKDEKEEKLYAKFETNGLSSFNCSINVIWKISCETRNNINDKDFPVALNQFISLDSSLNSLKDTSLNPIISYPIYISQIIQSGVYTIF
ncbi:uncharacterized protein T551_01047 [Pneumocystis jirovecii RU7]|uniref:MHD domain-containing protein n=1 Tax=Pneumocystis jirovecii (strain RU7) TaxID=1408657 RepID=A0A0W4ZTU5_PNEJ7|nr:uncharacterized protein T551_01047 [Pneumocystis jirovecii RU7]KTW31786.1 hypothetical protein T551_01047 [Pneumocystis jirovecii RU7]